jgi:glycosyltransferase involved in cell wall biosynthesis
MTKKIILLGSAYPYKVGSAQFNERLAKEFQYENYEIHIYTFTLQYPKFLFPGKTQFSSSETPKNLIIHRKINTINPFNWFKIGREIKKQKPDFIIIRYMMSFMAPSMGTIARISKKNKFTKVIGLIDNAIPHEKRFFDTFLSKFFFKSIDKFLYMSNKVKNDLLNFGIEKGTAYCPHPLFDSYGDQISKEVALKNLDLNPQNKYILFFGIIREYKGLDILLEAITNEYFKQNNIKLIIAGEFYSDIQKYKDIITNNKLTDSVIIHNKFIPDNNVSSYFSVADILVLPYRSATQSGVTQVGFYYDKPMLVTNVGGLGELIDETIGYTVEPTSTEIQNALLDFYQNNKTEKLTKGVSVKKEEFSWKRMVNTFNKLADEI